MKGLERCYSLGCPECGQRLVLNRSGPEDDTLAHLEAQCACGMCALLTFTKEDPIGPKATPAPAENGAPA